MVTRPLLALFALGVLAMPSPSAAAPRTMRVDYYHAGRAGEERFSLDRVVIEPLPWPGNPARPLDDTNLGQYFFEVIDPATSRPVYSRGFASIYGERHPPPLAGRRHIRRVRLGALRAHLRQPRVPRRGHVARPFTGLARVRSGN